MAVNSDIQQQVFDLLSKTSSLSFVSADRDVLAPLGLVPGQRVTAQVTSLLPNALVQVRLANQQMNLDLPMPVRVGQSLELTFVSGEPRTTFAIARQAAGTPPVSLSDASRLLGLLVENQQLQDPAVRSSLHGIAELLRRTSGEGEVLANLMGEALTYREDGEAGRAAGEKLAPGINTRADAASQERNRLTSFEANASQMLQQIARSSRFMLVEAANPPVVPLPLSPGDEVDAAVLGAFPGGKTFVKVAGTSLELQVPRTVTEGDVLRLTFISSHPKPLFALARGGGIGAGSDLSEAGRWLGSLEHHRGGASSQQLFVLERLNTILKSLPPGSPVFTAILDEGATYQTLLQRRPAGQEEAPLPGAIPFQQATQQGSGIVLSDEMTKLLQALLRGNRLALLEALSQAAVPAALHPGQQVRAEVLSATDGRITVQVAGQLFQFEMQKGVRRGDLLTLFFIAADPRPTFLATRFGRPGESRVSDTGRWLTGFLDQAKGAAESQRPVGLTQVLLEGPPREAHPVAAGLQRGLRESGLFYESHLARWFEGELPAEDLIREPQGRLSRLPLESLPASEEEYPAELPGLPGKASLDNLEAAFKRAGHTRELDGIADPRSLGVVREQLDSLQSGQVVFRGELYPGQEMEWSVREREARRSANGGRERTWETALHLELPRLGMISAQLVLEGGKVSVHVRTGTAEGAERLSREREKLAEQFESAGLAAGVIGVEHETV